MSVSSLEVVLHPRYWHDLCRKCLARVDRQPELRRAVFALDEDADPLHVFLATEIDKNARRMIVFIVWLSRRPDAYRHYRRIILQETDSCVQSLLRLALE